MSLAYASAPTSTTPQNARYEAHQRILEHLTILEWALRGRLGKDTVEYAGARRLIVEVIDDVEVLGCGEQSEESPKSGPIPKDDAELERLLAEVGLVEEEMASTLAQLALDTHNLMSVRGQETPGEMTMRHMRAAESMTVQIAELFRHAVSLREFARCGRTAA